MFTTDPSDPYYPGGFMEFDSSGNPMASLPHDSAFHGTHVSGTIAGDSMGGTAIGVAPGVSLMMGLVLPGGGGSFAQVIAGMQWCVSPFDKDGNPTPPAHVQSMSWGDTGGGLQAQLLDPIKNSLLAGVIPVAAIGNEFEGSARSPGDIWGTFGISATDINDNVAPFSSGKFINWPSPPTSWPFFGGWPSQPYLKPDFSAPGVNIRSAAPGGGYQNLDGTSMATPHVSGTVAMMVEASGFSLTPEQAYNNLRNSVLDFGAPGQDDRYGWGRLDTYKAVLLSLVANTGVKGTVYDSAALTGLKDVKVTAQELGAYTSTYANFTLFPNIPAFLAGTVTDSATSAPIVGALVWAEGPAKYQGVTDSTGSYNIQISSADAGTYRVGAFAGGFWPSNSFFTVTPGSTTTADFSDAPSAPANIAIYQDFQGQLAGLLTSAGDSPWSYQNPDAIDLKWNLSAFPAVYWSGFSSLNITTPPAPDTFLDILSIAGSVGTSIVFTDSYDGWPYGIEQLSANTGDPTTRTFTFGQGNVWFHIMMDHPIFAGVGSVNDTVVVLNQTSPGDADHTWFAGYTGDLLAHVGTASMGIQGDGVAVRAMPGGTQWVLLGTLAPQFWTNLVTDWTPNAMKIATNSVDFARNNSWVAGAGTHSLAVRPSGAAPSKAAAPAAQGIAPLAFVELTVYLVQQPSGLVVGTVTDTNGIAVEGVQIKALSTPVQTITDANGAYSMVLPVGTWTITAKKFGYQGGQGSATVTDGGTTTLDFVLVPQRRIGIMYDDHGNPLQAALEATDKHAITRGFSVGDIPQTNSNTCAPFSTFSGFSGTTVGRLHTGYGVPQNTWGDNLAYKITDAGTRWALMAAYAPIFGYEMGWTAAGKQIILNAVFWASTQPLSLAITPNHGAVGSAVGFTGFGAPANAALNVNFDEETLATTNANAAGVFSGNLAVPEAVYGAHSVIVMTPDENFAGEQSFGVVASLVLTPTSGPPSSGVGVAGHGYPSAAFVDLSFGSVGSGRALTGTDGSFVTTVIVPTVTAGDYFMSALNLGTGASASAR